MLAGKVSGRHHQSIPPPRIELSIYKTIEKTFMNMNFLLTVTLSFFFFKQMTGFGQTRQGSSTLIDRSLTVNFKFEEAWQESKILGKQCG